MSRSDWTVRLRLRHVDAAVVIVCLVAALPLCFARVNPFLRSADAVGERTARLSLLRESVARADRALAAQRDRLRAVQAQVDAERRRLQSAGHLNRRLARLTELAGATGLEVEEILPGQASRRPRYTIVPVTLTANGNYPTCAIFLARLKEAFPDTSVASFELNGYPQGPQRRARLHLDLRWHVWAAPGR